MVALPPPYFHLLSMDFCIEMLHVCASQDNAQFGEHIWFETSGSGDFCYVGEQYCFAKSLVSCSAPCGRIYTPDMLVLSVFTSPFMK